MLRNRSTISNFSFSLCAGLLLLAGTLSAEPVKVRHHQGEVHAFLVLRSESGKLLGTADEVNIPVRNAWQSRLTIHFLDGSLDDELATYTQGKVLHLLTDHHVQKGPSFPKPSDVTIDMAKGDVTYHETSNGKDSVKVEHMDLPADLGNGIMPMVLQNSPRGTAEIKVGYVVTTPKPRLVKFAIHPDGSERFRIGGVHHSAARYKLHVDIGGFQGLIAPMIGKEPPDVTAWISTGDAPTFLRMNGFLYLDGPIWRLELASPQW